MDLLKNIFKGDKVIWIIFLFLCLISIVEVFSAASTLTYKSGDHWGPITQHSIILMVGAVVVVFMHNIPYKWFQVFPVFLLPLSVVLLGLVMMMERINGAARWMTFMGIQFQPSEALKVATVLFLARQLAGRQSVIDKLRIIPSLNPLRWKRPDQRKIWREGTWPILAPVLLSCVVIFPAHTSSAVLVFFASWVMMLIGRVRIKELVKLLGLAFAAVMLAGLLNLGRSETAGGRVETWIDLWTKPQTEKPIDQLTDTERSMIAIHNGGILGEGAGQSAMRVEMIHPESDYAYAFFVEEYGIVLALALLMLYLWIFFRGIEIFRRCGTAFPGLLVLGLALLITCQALLHIMVTVNLIPETGQTLPLISRGGSSTIFTTIALGMILSVSRQNDEQSHDTPRSESIYEK